ncbi:DUF1615 family protein [Methylobacterium sp. Leaf118]|uniref:DUF1615 family protein n=1 Tax=Methylobacterium sp. Leaf118 TaxID=2876562 RepID=UPI001E400207|nr:DUF1615 family protein [Methylobacterium sp. Leaf118]
MKRFTSSRRSTVIARVGLTARRLLAIGVAALVPLAAPGQARAEGAPVERTALTRHIAKTHPRARDPAGWAADLLRALAELRFAPSPDNVCASVAIIGQESSFTASPQVPRLGEMAERKTLARLDAWSKERLLFSVYRSLRDEFLAKVRASRTEQDLDLAYRWLTRRLLDTPGLPFLLSTASNGRSLPEFFETRNEIKTLGAMQVSARFAIQAKTGKSLSELELSDIYRVRDSLYTRSGGLYYGTMQLLGYRADYESRLSMFADYNAGRYSSRNAAIQWMAGKLTGEAVALDGDLLAYPEGEAPRPGRTQAILWDILGKTGRMTQAQLHADLRLEKSLDFNRTDTFTMIRALYQARFRQKPPYERIPEIDLRKTSIKIAKGMTTEIFARAVNRRYEACRAALAPAPPVASAVGAPSPRDEAASVRRRNAAAAL